MFKYIFILIFFITHAVHAVENKPEESELPMEHLYGLKDKTGKYGLINSLGKFVIQPIYESILPEKEGFFIAKLDGKYGLLDAKGKVFKKFTFTEALGFSEGISALCNDAMCKFINTSGDVLFEKEVDGFGFFSISDEMILYKKGGYWGYMNFLGQEVIKPRFKYAYPFQSGIAAVSNNGNDYLYIDKKGKEIFGKEFDSVLYHATEGLVPVRLDGKWGYSNTNGEMIITNKYSSAYYFKDGLARVSYEGKTGFINREGSFIINPEWDNASYWFYDGLVSVQKNGKYGFIDSSGNLVVKNQYYDVKSFSEGRAAVLIGDKWGFINTRGEVVIEPKFDDESDRFKFGLARVSIDWVDVYVDLSGRVLDGNN